MPGKKTGAYGSYEVGYGKPPRHTQFQKGRSGNPCGGHGNGMGLEQGLGRLFGRKLTITENGKKRRILPLEGIAMAQLQKALKGDYRAANFIFELRAQLPEPKPPEKAGISPNQGPPSVLKHLDQETLWKIREAVIKMQLEDNPGEKTEDS